VSERLLRIERWRRIFAWTLWTSLLLLAVSVMRALGFTKSSLATEMDTTLIVGVAAAVVVLVAALGVVMTSIARRRERGR
jgi:uncharacterized membrane protein (DUF485 family)